MRRAVITETQPSRHRNPRFRFDRMEIAGSLGDLGTLIPLAVGMIVINGLEATSVLVAVGLFYVLAGAWFGLPVPVQPMKAIGAYAIAVAMTPQQIAASGAWMAVVLLLLALTGLIDLICRVTPKAAVRGVQLALGAILLIKGLRLMLDVDPGLEVAFVGPISTGLLIGAIGSFVALVLLHNRKLPAAMVILALGLLTGLLLGEPLDAASLSIGLHIPRPLPYGWPSAHDVVWVLPVVVLPQLPMTVGNAVIAQVDLTREYFPENCERVSERAITLSQGLANAGSFFLGGMPMCHGAGGLAGHYRFGQRTAGGNLFIGAVVLVLAILFGEGILEILGLLPQAVLGILLAFAGLELATMIRDLRERADFFVAVLVLGLSLATNLAVGFIVGLLVAQLARSRWVRV